MANPRYSTSAISINTTTIDVSSAELRSLFTAPKLLIAAPGANRILVLRSFVVLYSFGTVPYVFPGVVSIAYTTDIDATQVAGMGGVLSGATSRIDFMPSELHRDLSLVVNQPFILAGSVGDEIGGGDGVLNLILEHTVSVVP